MHACCIKFYVKFLCICRIYIPVELTVNLDVNKEILSKRQINYHAFKGRNNGNLISQDCWKRRFLDN